MYICIYIIYMFTYGNGTTKLSSGACMQAFFFIKINCICTPSVHLFRGRTRLNDVAVIVLYFTRNKTDGVCQNISIAVTA